MVAVTIWNGHQRRGGLTPGVSEAREHHQVSQARFNYRKIQQSMEHSGCCQEAGREGRSYLQVTEEQAGGAMKRCKLVSLLIFRPDLFGTKIF